MKTAFNKINLAKKQTGAVLVELALILPLIFTISLCGFEIIRALKYLKVATTFSKELANAALRNCDTTIDMQACLNKQASDLINSVGSLSAGNDAVLIITYQGLNSSENSYSASAVSSGAITSGNLPASRASSFISTYVSTGTTNEDNKISRSKGNIVIGECFIKYEPVFSFAQSILPFGFSGGYLYDLTAI